MTNLNATAQTTDMKIEIKEVAAQKVVTLKADAKNMEEISSLMEAGYTKLFDFLAANNIAPAGHASCVYYSWDEATGATTFDMCVPVASKVADKNGIVYKEFPAMRVASRLWVGPYDKMESVYISLENFVAENKLEKTGTVWDVYLMGPGQEKDPNNYQTEVFYTLK